MKKKSPKTHGVVFLVGAGPGDPDLITLKATQVLQKADIVFYDHLVNVDLLKWAPRAQHVYVGKVGHENYLSQAAIERRLKLAAHRFQTVVRLKGGDPFLFGRGGEEAEVLAKSDIPFQIIPGVSSALAVPSYAGIPLTHRDFSSELRIMTGHDKAEPFHIPQKFSSHQTLVILMGVQTMRENFKKLVAQGLDEETPAAMIEWGTYPGQKTIAGTLKTLPLLAEQAGIQAPAVIVVGKVVELRPALQWFEKRPLFGKKILVTRSRGQASELSQKLGELGAQVLELPTIEFRPVEPSSTFVQKLRNLKKFDWVFLTSVHAVETFFALLHQYKIDFRTFQELRFATVGKATSKKLSEYGFHSDVEPEEFNALALAKTFSRKEISGQKILFPRAQVASEEIVHHLQAKGAKVTVLPLYRTMKVRYSSAQLRDFFQIMPDLLTFTSSSTAENFSELIKKSPLRSALQKIPAVVIGPVTEKQARILGFRVAKKSKQAQIDSLVQAIVEVLK